MELLIRSCRGACAQSLLLRNLCRTCACIFLEGLRSSLLLLNIILRISYSDTIHSCTEMDFDGFVDQLRDIINFTGYNLGYVAVFARLLLVRFAFRFNFILKRRVFWCVNLGYLDVFITKCRMRATSHELQNGLEPQPSTSKSSTPTKLPSTTGYAQK